MRKKDSKYSKKEMQSETYNKQDKKCNMWLEQNLTPKKKISRYSLDHPPPTPFLKGGEGGGGGEVNLKYLPRREGRSEKLKKGGGVEIWYRGRSS